MTLTTLSVQLKTKVTQFLPIFFHIEGHLLTLELFNPYLPKKNVYKNVCCHLALVKPVLFVNEVVMNKENIWQLLYIQYVTILSIFFFLGGGERERNTYCVSFFLTKYQFFPPTRIQSYVLLHTLTAT